jgi:hypothetical protein
VTTQEEGANGALEDLRGLVFDLAEVALLGAVTVSVAALLFVLSLDPRDEKTKFPLK